MKQRLHQGFLSTILFFVIITAFNCNDPKGNPVGRSFFNRDLPDVAGPVPAPLNSVKAVQDTNQSNNSGSYLFVHHGDETNHSVQSVIFFAPPDTGNIHYASLNLIQKSFSGTYSNDIGVYAWTRAWQEAIDAGVSLANAPLGVKLAVLTSETTEEDTLTIALDPAWIQSWTDTSGLILASESSGLTAVFYSKNTATNSPTLNILMGGDSTETVRYPVQNRFIVNRPPRTDETVLTVDNGTSERIHLCFDVSSFSNGITINRARLRLAIDQDGTSPLSDDTFTMRAHPVTDLSGEIPAYESTTYITGTASGDSLVLELQSFCQSWIAGIRDNLGIILIGADEKTAITRRAFLFGSVQKTPDLEIYYSPSALSPENP